MCRGNGRVGVVKTVLFLGGGYVSDDQIDEFNVNCAIFAEGSMLHVKHDTFTSVVNGIHFRPESVWFDLRGFSLNY